MKPAGNARDKGKWSCPHHCDQAASIKSRGAPCKHLEKLIGPGVESAGNGRLIYSGLLDQFDKHRVELYDGDESSDEARLRAKLTQYEINTRKIDVVIDRLVRMKTFKEIAIDQGYAEASAAKRAYEDALKQLKKRGYGLGQKGNA